MSGNARSSGSNAGKVALAEIVVLTEQRLPLIETATRESNASACGADRPSTCNSCRSLFCVGLVCAASAYAIADERLHAAAPPEASAAAVERAARDAGRRRDASAKTRAPRWTAVRRMMAVHVALTTALANFPRLSGIYYLLGPLLTSLLDVRFAHWPVVDRGVRPRLLRALLQVRVESRP